MYLQGCTKCNRNLANSRWEPQVQYLGTQMTQSLYLEALVIKAYGYNGIQYNIINQFETINILQDPRMMPKFQRRDNLKYKGDAKILKTCIVGCQSHLQKNN